MSNKRVAAISTCLICNKEFSLFGYSRHIKSCKGEIKIKKRTAWNKGKTKSSDERIAKYAKTNSQTQTGKIGKPCSSETKAKISKARKKFLNENPDKIPYRLNHSSKESFPELYFAKCFDSLSSIHREYSVKRYNLDFANPLTKRYVEIDGEQHYVDPKIVKHDLKRNKVLCELGWDSIRIRWAKYQTLSHEDKVSTIHSLIEFLS
jgi:very-short-patch-repair endonuclease